MDRDFARKHQIVLHKLPCPDSVVVIDGCPIASGKIFKESEPIHILLGDLGCVVSFNIIVERQAQHWPDRCGNREAIRQIFWELV